MRKLPLYVLLIASSIATYLFMKGFFLSRIELPNYSPASDAFIPPSNGPLFDRVLIIIVDALRYDMATGKDAVTGEPCARRGAFCGGLPVLAQLRTERPEASRLLRFVADPPTATMQRIKGLMVGSLPTFLEIGQSFSAGAIKEDNLLLQMTRAGRKVVTIGDETWQDLFPPELFSAAHPFPSLDIFDLHGVDLGVAGLLPQFLDSNLSDTPRKTSVSDKSNPVRQATSADWSLLVAHTLGVDHCGHAFHVAHPEMSDKLTWTDGLIRDAVAALDQGAAPGGPFEGTLLLVFGDHGQTMSGDHGGGSPEETDSVILAYSPMLGRAAAGASLEPGSTPPTQAAINDDGTMPQLDLAATLAALSSVPAPYSSLGSIQRDLFMLGAKRAGLASPDDVYAAVLEGTAKQVSRYLEAYASQIPASSGLAREIQRLLKTWRATDLAGDRAPGLAGLELRSVEFLARAADLGRKHFAQFDLWSMCGALALLAATLLLTSLPSSLLPSPLWPPCALLSDTRSVAVLTIVLIKVFGPLSNSFILEEPMVVAYFTSSLAIVWLLSDLASRRPILPAALFLLSVRLLMWTGRLDEPSQWNPFATRRLTFVPPASLEEILSYLIPSAMVPLAVGAARSVAAAASGPLIVAAIGPRIISLPADGSFFAIFWPTLVSTALAGSFHHLRTAAPGASAGVTVAWLMLHLPRFVLLSSAVQIGIISNKSQMPSNVLIKAVSVLPLPQRRGRSASLLGGAILALLPLSLVVSGDRGPAVHFFAAVQLCCISYSFRRPTPQHFSQPHLSLLHIHLDAKLLGPLLSMLADLWFFASGHRCEFPALQYGSAYVGLGFYHPWLSGINLVLNTFWSTTLTALFALFLDLPEADLVSPPASASSETASAERSPSSALFTLNTPLAHIHAWYPSLPRTFSFAWTRAAWLFGGMLCGLVHKRHLMVWGLFAPRLLFECCFGAVTAVLVLCASGFL